MPRLLLILLVAAILLHAPPSAKATAVESSALLIRATPLALHASDPAQEQVARLRYLGGWDLTTDHPVFGGLSDRQSPRLNSSHSRASPMPSSASHKQPKP